MMDKLFEYDERWSAKFVLAEKKSLLRTLFIFISHSCDSWFWVLGLVLVLIFGKTTSRIMTIFWIFGLIFLALLVLGLKFLVKRRRPEGEWGQIYRITDPHSFPSGHSARAMAIAIMASQIGNNWLVYLLLIWGILVGISRVSLRLHYLSDIIVGWILGVLSGIVAIVSFPTFQRLVIGFLH